MQYKDLTNIYIYNIHCKLGTKERNETATNANEKQIQNKLEWWQAYAFTKFENPAEFEANYY